MNTFEQKFATHRAGLAIPDSIRALAVNGGKKAAALQFAEANNADDRTLAILKAAVSGESSTTLPELIGVGSAYSAYAQTLAASGAFYAAWAASLLQPTPFHHRINYQTGEVAAAIVGEGAPAPVTVLGFDAERLTPRKAVALIVATDEAWRDVSPNGQALINRMLRDATARAVDAEFLDELNPPAALVADPDSPAAIFSAIRQALALVATRSQGSFFWMTSPGAAASLSVLESAKFDPYGGRIVGLPSFMSDAVAADSLVLVDGSSVACNLGEMAMDVSSSGAFEMRDDPTNATVPPTPTTAVSLWQTHRSAAKMVVSFGCQTFRDNASAEISLTGS